MIYDLETGFSILALSFYPPTPPNNFVMGFCFLVISVSSVFLPERPFVTISTAAQNVYPTTVTPFGAGIVTGIRPSVFFLEYTSGGELNREGKDEERVERATKTGLIKVQAKQNDEAAFAWESNYQKVGDHQGLALPTHPDRFEEVKVGQKVALRLIEPVTGGLAYDFLGQARHVAVSNVNELLQRRRVAEVSEMEAEAFGQDLDRRNEGNGTDEKSSVSSQHPTTHSDSNNESFPISQISYVSNPARVTISVRTHSSVY